MIRDWVHYRLLPILECVHQFKGCVKERDFILGRNDFDNYNRCITNSASFLMIISNGFLEDRYCRYAMNLCSHTSESNSEHFRRVIPVLAETCVVPNELGFRAHFDADETANWGLLVKAITDCAQAKVIN